MPNKRWSTDRRLVAVRELANLSQRELGEAVNYPGLGLGPIRDIERGKRQIKPHEADLIGKVCEVNPAFLMGESNHLTGGNEAVADSLAERHRMSSFPTDEVEQIFTEANKKIQDVIRRTPPGNDSTEGSQETQTNQSDKASSSKKEPVPNGHDVAPSSPASTDAPGKGKQ